MSELDSLQMQIIIRNEDGTIDAMARKHAYITLQKGLRERFPPGPTLQAWLEWLDAVYAGDVKRPPPVTAASRTQAIPGVSDTRASTPRAPSTRTPATPGKPGVPFGKRKLLS